MRLQNLLLSAVVAVVLAGCNCGGGGGSDGGGGGTGGAGGGTGGGTGGAGGGTVDAGPPQIAIDQFCAAASSGFKNQTIYETIVCNMPVTSNDIPHVAYYAYLPGLGGDFVPFPEYWEGSDCAIIDGGTPGLGEQMARYRAAVMSGRVKYDGVAALACQTEGKDSRDGGGLKYPNSPTTGALAGACANIWQGQVMTGGACDAFYECAPGGYCKRGDVNSCAGTCQPLIAIDGACSDVDPCAAGTECSDAPDGGMICVALEPEGSSCDDSNGPYCGPGLTCYGPQGNTVCRAIAVIGQPCLKDASEGTSTCGEGTCVTGDGGVQGTCMARAMLGQACGTGTDGLPGCDFCGECNSGLCQVYGQAGAACQDVADCFDERFYFCGSNSQCAVRPRATEACDGPIDPMDDEDNRANCMYLDNFCARQGTATAGTCTALPGVGMGCSLMLDATTATLSPRCAAGFCSNTDGGLMGTCANNPASGQPCGFADGYTSRCAQAADFCDTRADAGGDDVDLGTCRARSAVGETCVDGVRCAFGLACDDRDGGASCIALLADNEPCTDDSQCQNDNCLGATPTVLGACTPLFDNGQACARNSECKSGECDDTLGVCRAACEDVAFNQTNGCMNYDLVSLSSYLFFSMILGGVVLRRRRKK